MIANIERRPFFRLLVWWITGIVWYYYFPLYWYFCLFLFIAVVLLLCDGLQKKFRVILPYSFSYWSTSALMGAVIIALSILITHYNINNDVLLLPEICYEWQHYIRIGLLSYTDKLALSADCKAVFAAITFGETTFLTTSVRYSFSGIGIAHVLAVSGFHVGVVAGFIKIFFTCIGNNKTGRILKSILSIVIIWIFAFVAGMSIPTLRASIMITLYFASQLLMRSSDSYNNLFFAAFILLLIDPESFFNIGFQLSFLAVWFILYLYPKILLLIPVRNPLVSVPWQWIAISLAAQVGTCVLSVYYFKEFSFLFVLTNLFVSLLATCIIPAGLIWFLLPDDTWLHLQLKGVLEIMVQTVCLLVEKFNNIQGMALTFDIGLGRMFTLYLLVFTGIIYSRMKKPILLLFILGLILLLIILELF